MIIFLHFFVFFSPVIRFLIQSDDPIQFLSTPHLELFLSSTADQGFQNTK